MSHRQRHIRSSVTSKDLINHPTVVHKALSRSSGNKHSRAYLDHEPTQVPLIVDHSIGNTNLRQNYLQVFQSPDNLAEVVATYGSRYL